MPLTVLFDLDDTLLTTNMDRFLPGYFNLLSSALSHLGSQEQITQQVHYAVEKMIANQDPRKTLKEVFADNFYSALGTHEADCQPRLDIFYQHEYPTLKPVTQLKPIASKLVNWCLSEGIRMAVATNPLFPNTATRQRIEWAGLDPGHFAFFTSYDDFHFTKPHLAYYAEVLGCLGWPEGPIVMIGDNLAYDLFPMDRMGFGTYWVNQERRGIKWEGGTLSEVKQWLQKVSQNRGFRLINEPEVNLAIIRSTPAVFDTIRKRSNLDQHLEIPQDSKKKAIGALTHAITYEEEVYHPLWARISTDPQAELPPFGEISLKNKNIRNYSDLKAMVNLFIAARNASLKHIDAMDLEMSFDPPDHVDQNDVHNWPKLLDFMADQDRLLLRHWAELLDIHKIN